MKINSASIGTLFSAGESTLPGVKIMGLIVQRQILSSSVQSQVLERQISAISQADTMLLEQYKGAIANLKA